MERFSLTGLLLLVSTFMLHAQDNPWDAWDREVLARLYTSRETPYLDEEEKKVVLFMNMARHDGALFASTFLENYVEAYDVKESSYLRSLEKELKSTSQLPPLIPEEDLFKVAEGHAVKSGKNGTLGHQDMEKRFAPLVGNPYMAWGENCAYGYEEAIQIVVILLIDEDIPDLGHRKNILSPDFNSVGVAMRPHTTYRSNCVIDFGKKTRSNLNQVPF